MISRLKDLTEKGLVNDEVEELEDIIAEEIEKHVKEESFYELPTNEISKIIKKSEIGDDVLLCDVISKMNKNKGE